MTMKRYRLKHEVEAQQWHAGDPPLEGMEPMARYDPDALFIRTRWGYQRVCNGDWIVVNEHNRPALFSAADFKRLYEPVE